MYCRIYLEARANSEKLRRRSRFSGSRESLQSIEKSSAGRAGQALARSTSFVLMSSIRKRVSLLFQKHKEELHTARISLFIVVLILTCWLPFHVENLLLRLEVLTSPDVPKWLRCLTHILVAIYPSLSPCLFAFRCKKLQRELRRTLRRRRTDLNEDFRRKAIRKFPLESAKLNIDSQATKKVSIVDPRSKSPPTSSTDNKSLS